MAKSFAAKFFLAVAFPSNHVRILPYNRVVRDLNGHIPEGFLGELARRGFAAERGTAIPSRKGETSMYVGGAWYCLDLESAGKMGDGLIDSLDCNVLQEKLLTPSSSWVRGKASPGVVVGMAKIWVWSPRSAMNARYLPSGLNFGLVLLPLEVRVSWTGADPLRASQISTS